MSGTVNATLLFLSARPFDCNRVIHARRTIAAACLTLNQCYSAFRQPLHFGGLMALRSSPQCHVITSPGNLQARGQTLARCASKPRKDTHGILLVLLSLVAADHFQAQPGDAPASAVVGYFIEPASEMHHLQETAQLRADAYYEEQAYSRFTDTFKRKFAEQELQSLVARTALSGKLVGASQQPCVCLVALDSSGKVRGCVDVRPPQAHSGVTPKGVANGDLHGGYLLNVVVEEDHRGQGLGAALVKTAQLYSQSSLLAQRLYTHVDAQNEVALRLYLRCGFQQREGNAGGVQGVAGSNVGKQLSLVAELLS